MMSLQPDPTAPLTKVLGNSLGSVGVGDKDTGDLDDRVGQRWTDVHPSSEGRIDRGLEDPPGIGRGLDRWTSGPGTPVSVLGAEESPPPLRHEARGTRSTENDTHVDLSGRVPSGGPWGPQVRRRRVAGVGGDIKEKRKEDLNVPSLKEDVYKRLVGDTRFVTRSVPQRRAGSV